MIIKTLPLYVDRQAVTLTPYVISDSPELLNGKKRPAVLVCPGGAYLSCSDREAEPVALRFATMGYHAFVLRYSTYNNGAPGMVPLVRDLPVNPRSVHPAPAQPRRQLAIAVRDVLREPRGEESHRLQRLGRMQAAEEVLGEAPQLVEQFGVLLVVHLGVGEGVAAHQPVLGAEVQAGEGDEFVHRHRQLA